MKNMIHLKNSKAKTWNGAATKGALVWGPVYSTATSGAAYFLVPVMTGSSPAFPDILMNSLVICSTAGAARGIVLWRLDKERHKAHKHPWRVHKKAA